MQHCCFCRESTTCLSSEAQVVNDRLCSTAEPMRRSDRSTCIQTNTPTRAGCSALPPVRLQNIVEPCADAIHLPQIIASLTRPKYLRMLCPAAGAALITQPVVTCWDPMDGGCQPTPRNAHNRNHWLVEANQRGYACPDRPWMRHVDNAIPYLCPSFILCHAPEISVHPVPVSLASFAI